MPLSLRLRSLLQILVLATSAMGGHALATVSCTTSLTLAPPLPTQLSVLPGAAVGTVLYHGTLTSTHTCNGVETSARGYVHTLVNGGAWPLALSPNNTLGLQSSEAGKVVSSGGCPAFGGVTNYSTSRQLLGLWWGAGSSFSGCSITVKLPVDLVVMQLPVSGASVTGSSVVVGQCGNTQPWGCTNTSADGVTTNVINIGSGTTIPVVLVGGCTLAASTYSVRLPDVPRTDLNSRGRTAGLTPFSLQFAGCSTEVNYSVSARWEFIEDQASNIIANTATGGAANTAVQILDANYVAVANNQLSLLQATGMAGARSVQYYAQYIALNPVDAGPVLGTATFTLVYQ